MDAFFSPRYNMNIDVNVIPAIQRYSRERYAHGDA